MSAREVGDREEAERVAQFLASMPAGHTTVTRGQLRELLLRSDGTMMACGSLYNIRAKHIGAGVYSVRLVRP